MWNFGPLYRAVILGALLALAVAGVLGYLVGVAAVDL
jgi:hypothetical protein